MHIMLIHIIDMDITRPLLLFKVIVVLKIVANLVLFFKSCNFFS